MVRVDNFVPGKMDELGIGYDVLRAVNPSIIHASISGIVPMCTAYSNIQIIPSFLLTMKQATAPVAPTLIEPDTTSSAPQKGGYCTSLVSLTALQPSLGSV
jgi:hypothetical protein